MTEEAFDLFEMILSHPPGSFKYFHSEGKEVDIQQALKNKDELQARIAHARNSNCFIEVISLRLQHLEMWLRIYYNNSRHNEPRQQEFGRLIKQCFKIGLNKNIYDRLSTFNKDRRISIHGYLMGQMKYNDFYKTIEDSDTLSQDLIEFVILNAGEVVTEEHRTSHNNVGDLIFFVDRVLADLKSSKDNTFVF
ncbi:hypothetical protein Q1J68_10875 [Pseudomonas pergaminensis]|uniref:hypothetical protein n=1 Tax=Pseudomonas pergaminensis TaxID=2853159 RepID=UPI0034D46FD0